MALRSGQRCSSSNAPPRLDHVRICHRLCALWFFGCDPHIWGRHLAVAQRGSGGARIGSARAARCPSVDGRGLPVLSLCTCVRACVRVFVCVCACGRPPEAYDRVMCARDGGSWLCRQKMGQRITRRWEVGLAMGALFGMVCGHGAAGCIVKGRAAPGVVSRQGLCRVMRQ